MQFVCNIGLKVVNKFPSFKSHAFLHFMHLMLVRFFLWSSCYIHFSCDFSLQSCITFITLVNHLSLRSTYVKLILSISFPINFNWIFEREFKGSRPFVLEVDPQHDILIGQGSSQISLDCWKLNFNIRVQSRWQ